MQEIKLSFEAIYNYWFQEVAPYFWLFIQLYIPLSFLIYVALWKGAIRKERRKTEREFSDSEYLKARTRKIIKMRDRRIQVQQAIIRRLNSKLVGYRSKGKRTKHIWKDDE
jgi:hypothetical protein